MGSRELRWETFRICAAGPYDGARLLAFLGAHAVPGLESWDGATYRRTLSPASGRTAAGRTAGRTSGPGWAVLEVQAVPGGVTGRIGLPGHHPDPAGTLGQVLPAVGHLLALDRDDGPAEAALAADPMIGPLLALRPGLRLPGSADPAQDLVRTVIGQQVSVAGARTVTGRVVAALGAALPGPVTAQTGLTRLWPTAAALAGAPDRALPMPMARARAVRAVAAAVAAGLPLRPVQPDAEQPGAGQPDAGQATLRAALLALPGVGPWTADYTLVRALRHPDVFLPGDLAARRQVAALGGPGDPAGVAALAERWRPYRTTALGQLWAAYLAF